MNYRQREEWNVFIFRKAIKEKNMKILSINGEDVTDKYELSIRSKYGISHKQIIAIEKSDIVIKRLKKESTAAKMRMKPETLLSLKYNAMVARGKINCRFIPKFSKEKFIKKFKHNEKYLKLFYQWKKQGCNKWYIPSVDRTNPLKTYSFENITIMTWRQNLIKAHKCDMKIHKQERMKNKLRKERKTIYARF